MHQPRAFTLVEMLLVVAIIVLLIAMLLPALHQATGQARMASCASQLHQVHTAIIEYQTMFHMKKPWQFANGSGDYPHESGHSATRPGTPARALVLLTGILGDARLLFCPDVPIDYDTWYDPTPNSSFTKFHGTYAYHYHHLHRAVDPTPAGNGITYINEASEDVIMLDTSHATWSSWGFPYRYEHYNALMLDGEVKLVTRDRGEIQYWLWGSAGKPYD